MNTFQNIHPRGLWAAAFGLMCVVVAQNFVDEVKAAGLGGCGTGAHWKFAETSGQLAQSTAGSSTAVLQFGSSTAPDKSDPNWTEGLSGSAIVGRRYTSSNAAIYCRNSGWSVQDIEHLSPDYSYSIEAIVDPNWFPTAGDWDNLNPMGIIKYRDRATNKHQYNLQLYTDGDLHHRVRFFSHHADGSYTDFLFDPQPAGLTINTHNWYYIAAIYTDEGTGSGTVEVIVRDMSTGMMVSGTTACKPVYGMAANPNPEFLVGSEYTNSSGHCFDGKIDEVRISHVALPENQRLYSGDWGIFKSDLNRDGYVDTADLRTFFDYWLDMPGYGLANLVVNGDAEYGYDYYGWSEGERPDLCTINRTDEASACFEISNAGSPDARCDFGQSFIADVTPGESLLLKFRYKTLPGYVIGGPGGAKLQIRFFDINNNWKGEHDVILTSTNNQWVDIEAPLNVLSDPSICRADMCVKFRHWDTAEGTIRLDDIQLYNRFFPQQDSLILNSGAESATDFAYWGHGGPATIVNRTDAASGTSCFEMDNTAAPNLASDLVTYRYNVDPNEPLFLSFSYKTLPGFSITDSAGFRLQPRFWDSPGNFKGEYNFDLAPTGNQWVKVAFLIKALRDTSITKLDIRISLRDFGVAVGKARFDDVQLFTMDSSRVLAPVERIDTDGFVDFTDFADFAAEWLLCSDPVNANCVHVQY
jgi:hypothetical protein